MALNDFKDTNQGGGVLTVSNSNIGKGIKWNPATNQYEVALSDELFINNEGLIQLKAGKPKIETFDYGTGKVKHRRAIIDYGGFIEVSGIITLGWMNSDFATPANVSAGMLTAETNRLKSIYGPGLIVYQPSTVTTGQLYTVETGYNINVAELGISKVFSVSCTAGDIDWPRNERAWVIADIQTLNTVVPIGFQTDFSPGQTEGTVSYTIKGTKA